MPGQNGGVARKSSSARLTSPATHFIVTFETPKSAGSRLDTIDALHQLAEHRTGLRLGSVHDTRPRYGRTRG